MRHEFFKGLTAALTPCLGIPAPQIRHHTNPWPVVSTLTFTALLVIYPVQLKSEKKELSEEAAVINNTKPLIGISVGIPEIKGRASQEYQYKINLVKYRELVGMDEPEEIDDTIED